VDRSTSTFSSTGISCPGRRRYWPPQTMEGDQMIDSWPIRSSVGTTAALAPASLGLGRLAGTLHTHIDQMHFGRGPRPLSSRRCKHLGSLHWFCTSYCPAVPLASSRLQTNSWKCRFFKELKPKMETTGEEKAYSLLISHRF
jgi:hypothetical protein